MPSKEGVHVPCLEVALIAHPPPFKLFAQLRYVLPCRTWGFAVLRFATCIVPRSRFRRLTTIYYRSRIFNIEDFLFVSRFIHRLRFTVGKKKVGSERPQCQLVRSVNRYELRRVACQLRDRGGTRLYVCTTYNLSDNVVRVVHGV